MNYYLLDRSVISIEGPDSPAYLQGIITNDINQTPCYSLMLSPQGKYLFDFFIIFQDGKYLIDVDSKRAQELIAKFNSYKLRSKILIEDVTDQYNVYSIPDSSSNIGYQDSRHLSFGRRLISQQQLTGEPITDKSYDQYRLELGIVTGEDMIIDKSYPLEYGIDKLNGISFTKGCYVGQEVTTRTKHRGVIRKTIYKIRSENILPLKGAELIVADQNIGLICASEGAIGLALIKLEAYHNMSAPTEFKLELPIWNNLKDN